jgi:hypothetical protein
VLVRILSIPYKHFIIVTPRPGFAGLGGYYYRVFGAVIMFGSVFVG